MSKSQNNNIFVWIGLCILLILPNIARTQSVKLYVTDSLTEEIVTSYSVYIDDSIVFPSLDETHVAHFVLDNAIDHTFRIRVHKFHYYDRIFDLKMPKTLSDTTVQVKMNYIFSEPQLPMFFFRQCQPRSRHKFQRYLYRPDLVVGVYSEIQRLYYTAEYFLLFRRPSTMRTKNELREKHIGTIWCRFVKD